MPLPLNWAESLKEPSFLFSVAAVILHVINYNVTAQLEYRTRIFTKVFGKNTIYIYALYLIISALARDYVIRLDLLKDSNSLSVALNVDPHIVGGVLFGFGVFLNLWTLWELGIKGMYNGDSFGWLFDEPVVSGPFAFFSDPQYLGTSVALLGSAVYALSFRGLVLSAIMYTVFMLSVDYVEGPHLKHIYADVKKSALYPVSSVKPVVPTTKAKKASPSKSDDVPVVEKAAPKSPKAARSRTSSAKSTPVKAKAAAESPAPSARSSPRRRGKAE